MKYGVNTFIWDASFGPSWFHILPDIERAGFDGIEVPILKPLSLQAEAIRTELDAHGLECTAVTVMPPGLSLAAPDASVRQGARQHVQDCIHAAVAMGARLLAGPMYSPVGYMTGTRRTADEWKWLVESWQRLGEVVSQTGIEIAIEPLNRFETYFLNVVEDAVRFCDELRNPSIGILIDVFHANIEEKRVANAVRAAGPRLKHLHVSENDRGTPGTGHTEWSELFSAVAEIGYDRWITIESFGFTAGEMATAASIWRDLAATPEAIAYEGLQFLRRASVHKHQLC